jgi:hypothetical protein
MAKLYTSEGKLLDWLSCHTKMHLVSVTSYPTFFLPFSVSFYLNVFFFLSFFCLFQFTVCLKALCLPVLSFAYPDICQWSSRVCHVVVWLTHVERSDERSPAAMTFLQWWHLQLIFFIRRFLQPIFMSLSSVWTMTVPILLYWHRA